VFPAPFTLRASDADRERTVAYLNEHCAQGRLSLDELSSRLDAAYGAVGLDELDALTHDLPGSPFAPAAPARRELARRRLSTGLGLGVAAVLAVVIAAAVPAEVWAPLILLGLPMAAMLLFTILPVAVPVLAVAWIVRGLARDVHDPSPGVRRRARG